MSLSNKQIQKLEAIIAGAQALLSETKARSSGRSSQKTPSAQSVRRTGKALVAFRRMVVSERKKGIPAAEIARKHNVSTVYIYKLDRG